MHCFNLTGFAINNFRVFGEQTSFNLAPLTILTGTNSSGKSSFTKALHLLTESYKANGLRQLELMESNLKIGSFDSIKNSLNKKREISFVLEIEEQNPDFFFYYPTKFSIELNFIETGLKNFIVSANAEILLKRSWNKDLYTLNESFIKLGEEIINKEKITEIFGQLPKVELNQIFVSILNYLQTNIDAHRINDHYSNIDIDQRNFDRIDQEYMKIIGGLKLLGEVKTRTKRNVDLETNKEFEYKEDIVGSANPTLKNVLPSHILEITDERISNLALKEFVNLDYLNTLELFPLNMLGEVFNRFEFIEGVRATQEIVYTKTNSPGFYKILSELQSEHSYVFGKLQKWIVEEFKLIQLKEGQKIEDVISLKTIAGYGYILQIIKDGKDIGLNGLGYGVSQLLPILIKVILKPDAIFIIEEPESNLHPALQSKLADFFTKAIKSISMKPPRFIIETHSEYLIRKLQYLTAKGEIKPEQSQVYFFNHPEHKEEGEEQIKKININKDGSLTDNFGQGFIDEATSWKFELLKLNNSQNN